MKLQRFALSLAGAGLLAAAAASAPAAASGQADPKPYFSERTARPLSAKAAIAATPCISAVGVPTAAGTMQEIDATPPNRPPTPPTADIFEPFPTFLKVGTGGFSSSVGRYVVCR